MKNENRTMTPLSKCLYKSMKIDPLGRFLEGKTNGSYAFMVDMAEKSGNKLTKTAD